MHKERLARLGILLTLVLFTAKLIIALRTHSTAVLSDALNSLLDIMAYTALHLGVKFQEKAPDANHPFGHRRAEPLAGFIIALLAALLGAGILKEAGFSLFTAQTPVASDPFGVPVMLVAIGAKLILAWAYWRAWKRYHSFAMQAGAIDSRNDVLASGLALSGLLIGSFWDTFAGLLIGGWILISGIRIGLDSLGYLMGRVPDESVLEQIRQATLAIPGVVDFNDLRAHFVGDRVHVEIHIEVDDSLSLRQAHDISLTVRYTLQALPEIDRAFIHIDPIRIENGKKVRETPLVTEAPIPKNDPDKLSSTGRFPRETT